MRHLINRPQQTILTFVGIMLGAAGYIVFAGIQIGYQDYVIEKLINIDAYVRISPRDEIITEATFRNMFFTGTTIHWVNPPSGRASNSYLSNIHGWFNRLNADPSVVAYSTQIVREVIFSHGKFSLPVRLAGIDPEKQSHVTNLEGDIIAGALKSVGKGDSLILLGEELMNRLGANLNGTIHVTGAGGVMFPVKIVSIYRTGVKQIDNRIAYSSITTVQKITQSPGEISDIVVRLKDVHSAADTAAEWSRYSTDKVESWDQAKEDIRVTLKAQTIVRNATTFTIILIVAFGIYNILNMVVNQKKREIAILRSIGYDETDTVILFLLQGVLLGVFGALIGMCIGYVSCYYIEKIPIGTGIGHMPMSWDAVIYMKAFILVVSSSLIASFIPARNAGRLSPIEIIRGSS